ncbi:TetR/AcrR family transcriptional regulator [Zhengella sp. ZM62]|uniref:TetR/AcrR family transcriptional regulator n=1 Tax=Zhengella sedimenti TaxID=3390035 RepID=UPI0039769D1D
MRATGTRETILVTARTLLGKEGQKAVSFDAIARRMGVSKQAVLYWFPSKPDLLAAMFLPWLESEAETAERALAGATTRADAVAAFVRAIAAFHFSDLDRFRMMYLALQTAGSRRHRRPNDTLARQVHPVTDRLYSALEAKLGEGRGGARAEAAAIHAAVLGMVMMIALGDSLDDPLKHSNDTLVDSLIAALTATGYPADGR